MEKINVKIKKTIEKAVLPKIATEFSAGADLYACLETENLVIKSGETVFVHTGLAVEIPVGTTLRTSEISAHTRLRISCGVPFSSTG